MDSKIGLNNLDGWTGLIPKYLVESFYESNRPVIFLGSGFGKEAIPPLKTGEQLALMLRTELNLEDHGEDLSELLQYLQNLRAGSKVGVIDWLKSQLYYDASSPGGAHRLLLELPTNEFLTTNYDSLLAAAARQMGYNLIIADTPKSYNIGIRQYRNKEKAGVLGRLYGGFDNNEGNITVTTNDYVASYNDNGRGWADILREYFSTRRVILIGYNIRDFTTWTSFVSVLKEGKMGLHSHFLISPINSNHFSDFWRQYNITHIPLKAHQFLIAIHNLLGNLTSDSAPEEIAIAAAAAYHGKIYEEFIQELEIYKKQFSYPSKRLTALKLLTGW